MNAANGIYKGALDCAKQTVVRYVSSRKNCWGKFLAVFCREGVSALYRGFAASCSRLVSWNIVLWLSYEQIKIATCKKWN